VKRLFLVFAAAALLLPQFGDCMSAMGMDQQAMRCCRSMPCTPANRSQGCCKNMLSAQMPNMLPVQHVSLHVPTLTTIEYPRLTEVLGHAPALPLFVEAQQHSPPELYTLHASLLI
jgi:hypothetical protein